MRIVNNARPLLLFVYNEARQPLIFAGKICYFFFIRRLISKSVLCEIAIFFRLVVKCSTTDTNEHRKRCWQQNFASRTSIFEKQFTDPHETIFWGAFDILKTMSVYYFKIADVKTQTSALSSMRFTFSHCWELLRDRCIKTTAISDAKVEIKQPVVNTSIAFTYEIVGRELLMLLVSKTETRKVLVAKSKTRIEKRKN